MQEIEMAMEQKIKEINAFVSDTDEERLKLLERLEMLDASISGAHKDLHTIKQALSVIRGEPEAMLDPKMGVPSPLSSDCSGFGISSGLGASAVGNTKGASPSYGR